MAMTAKELLAKKSSLIARKNSEINIQLEGVGVWRMAVPTANDILDATTYAELHKKDCRGGDDNLCLVYFQTVEPNLRDPELVKAVAEEVGRNSESAAGPWIVDALLLPGQVKRTATILLEKAGYSMSSAQAVVDAEMEVAAGVKN